MAIFLRSLIKFPEVYTESDRSVFLSDDDDIRGPGAAGISNRSNEIGRAHV